LEDSLSNNLLVEEKPLVEEKEEEILNFEDEVPDEKPVKELEKIIEKPEELSEKRPEQPMEAERPEDEIGMAYDFTIPKQKLLDKNHFPFHERMIEPISQDVATSHLSPIAVTIVHDNYNLILNILALSNMTGKHMVEAQRFHVGKISTYANVSKGELGNLLKLLRSNYNITEQKTEERLQTDQKVFEESKQKTDMFGLPMGGR
jgi:hypothetical protein